MFSRNALKIARELYFKDLSDDVINGFLRDKDIELSDTDLYSFSTHEKNLALKYWRIHEREYLDKIIIREVMRGMMVVHSDYIPTIEQLNDPAEALYDDSLFDFQLKLVKPLASSGAMERANERR